MPNVILWALIVLPLTFVPPAVAALHLTTFARCRRLAWVVIALTGVQIATAIWFWSGVHLPSANPAVLIFSWLATLGAELGLFLVLGVVSTSYGDRSVLGDDRTKSRLRARRFRANAETV